MATVKTEIIDIRAANLGSSIRALVARPSDVAIEHAPVVIAWSDIFQLTAPHVRMVTRLASYGFTVIAPELYGRLEPAGTALDFERDRARALEDASRLEPAWIDEERRALVDHAKGMRPSGGIGALGFCFGGHLAFRAAIEPEIAACVCFYPTGVHDGNLGTARGTAGTLARARDIKGELLLVFGTRDPHVPAEGRETIVRSLEEAGTRHSVRLFDAEHAFARDEGPRWNPRATDDAFAAMIALFRGASM